MTDRNWTSTFEDAERFAAQAAREASAEQRLLWLEEALRIAHRSGALKPYLEEKFRRSEAGWDRRDADDPGEP
ncbi:MAG TPA: hypothetical protein VLV83_06785 [Acidobacteriota bacterium]|nr:hypothetical protein [Acidobacteriota bacterium]